MVDKEKDYQNKIDLLWQMYQRVQPHIDEIEKGVEIPEIPEVNNNWELLADHNFSSGLYFTFPARKILRVEGVITTGSNSSGRLQMRLNTQNSHYIYSRNRNMTSPSSHSGIDSAVISDTANNRYTFHGTIFSYGNGTVRPHYYFETQQSHQGWDSSICHGSNSAMLTEDVTGLRFFARSGAEFNTGRCLVYGHD